MENPWDICSIYELQYFNCPNCYYKHNSKQEFIIHAYENHPNAIQFLNKIRTKSLSDIICPWLAEDIIKIEKHPEGDLEEVKTEFTTNEAFIDNNYKEFNEPSDYLEVSVDDENTINSKTLSKVGFDPCAHIRFFGEVYSNLTFVSGNGNILFLF